MHQCGLGGGDMVVPRRVIQEPAPRAPTSVHKQMDLGEDVLQGQTLQRLQLCDF